MDCLKDKKKFKKMLYVYEMIFYIHVNKFKYYMYIHFL